MTIAVIDAAAVVDVLCRYRPAARVEKSMRAASDVIAPAHLDAEVFQALARIERAGDLPEIESHVGALARLSIHRLPIPPLLARAYDLLGQIAAKDALYVALALSVDGALITTDERLRRATRGVVELA
ncbi:MAG: type II toxin-antitoxin system VapC family toxin [Acidimicrobiia bacterium]